MPLPWGQRGAGSASCSPASPRFRWRLRLARLRPPLQVGTGDDPGQDAQPRLHRLLLRAGVLRGCSPGGLPAGPPGSPVAPGGTLRPVSSGVVLHILSLCLCDGVSVSCLGSSFRIISFTSYRVGSSASPATPQQSVANGTATENYLWALSTLITPTGPSASVPFPAVAGVYRRSSFVAEPSGVCCQSWNRGKSPLYRT